MMRRFATLVCLAAVVLAGAVDVSAQSERDSVFHRWAVGWDNGLGMRYMLSEKWGVGVQVRPQMSDDSYDSRDIQVYDTTTTVISTPTRSSQSKDLSVGILLFRSVRMGRWFGVGPYGGLSYGYNLWEFESVRVHGETRDYSRSRKTAHSVTLELGVRPTFPITDRFVLETRFGLALTYTNGTARAWTESGDRESERSSNSDLTRINSFGHNLGPGATMQFMIYF